MAERTARRLALLLAREAALVARLADLRAGGAEAGTDADMVKALTRRLFDVRVRRRNLGRNARRAGGLAEESGLDNNSNVIKKVDANAKDEIEREVEEDVEEETEEGAEKGAEEEVVEDVEEEVEEGAGGDPELGGEAWPCSLPTCSSSNPPSRVYCRRCGSPRPVRENAATVALVMHQQRADVEQILGIMHRQRGQEREVPLEKMEEETPSKGKVKEIVESIEKLEVAENKEMSISERKMFPARRLAPRFPPTSSSSYDSSTPSASFASASSSPSNSFTSIKPRVEVEAPVPLLVPSTPSGGVAVRRRGRRVEREEVRRRSSPSPSYPGCTCPSPRGAPRPPTPCTVHPTLHHLLG